MIIRQLAQNRAWGGFLDGIPPHRFEPHSVLEKRGEKIGPLSPIRPKGSERKPGASDCPAAWPSVLRYAPSHAQGARWGAQLPRSVRSPQMKKRRSSERRNKDWSGHKGLMDALRAPLPLRLKPSGEFLKTAHWAVFLAEFHLIGSSPAPYSKTKKTAGAFASAVKFLERTTGLEPATPTLARWCSTN